MFQEFPGGEDINKPNQEEQVAKLKEGYLIDAFKVLKKENSKLFHDLLNAKDGSDFLPLFEKFKNAIRQILAQESPQVLYNTQDITEKIASEYSDKDIDNAIRQCLYGVFYTPDIKNLDNTELARYLKFN